MTDLRLRLPAQPRAHVEVVIRLKVDQILGGRVELCGLDRLLGCLGVARALLAALLLDAREERVAHGTQRVRRPAAPRRARRRVAAAAAAERHGAAVLRARLGLAEALQQAPARALPLESVEEALARAIGGRGLPRVVVVLALRLPRAPPRADQAAARAPRPEAREPRRRRLVVAARRGLRDDGRAGALPVARGAVDGRPPPLAPVALARPRVRAAGRRCRARADAAGREASPRGPAARPGARADRVLLAGVRAVVRGELGLEIRDRRGHLLVLAQQLAHNLLVRELSRGRLARVGGTARAAPARGMGPSRCRLRRLETRTIACRAVRTAVVSRQQLEPLVPCPPRWPCGHRSSACLPPVSARVNYDPIGQIEVRSAPPLAPGERTRRRRAEGATGRRPAAC